MNYVLGKNKKRIYVPKPIEALETYPASPSEIDSLVKDSTSLYTERSEEDDLSRKVRNFPSEEELVFE